MTYNKTNTTCVHISDIIILCQLLISFNNANTDNIEDKAHTQDTMYNKMSLLFRTRKNAKLWITIFTTNGRRNISLLTTSSRSVWMNICVIGMTQTSLRTIIFWSPLTICRVPCAFMEVSYNCDVSSGYSN